ncbi:MAG: PD-(D/E)XK nuclease family protein [Planctomycetia bacterium]|nr:PD-(D/E)XK nuclease family protein [Planctomycetia bacterium]
MAAHVTVVTGPARAGKTERLLARYRQGLAELPPGAALWIAPTQRAARDVLSRLLDERLPACLAPGVMTFDGFAQAVVDASGQPVYPLSASQKRHLLRWLIDGLFAEGKLAYFGPILHTSGLVDLVSQFMSDLKRLEIWPEEFRRACQKRGMTPKDGEMLEIYSRYQERLTRHQLYDAEGRFWSARHLLREGQRRPFEELRVVVVDGFADFTRTQHEILQILAGRVETLLVSLPLDRAPGRDDLFAKSRGTLEKLLALPGAACEEVKRDGRSWPAMDRLEAELFRSPPSPPPGKPMGGVELVGCSRELGEVEWIGRTIKSLLLWGDRQSGKGDLFGERVAPGDVAVVFRSLHDAGPLVREVFTELGIPFAIESSPPLSQSPVGRALAGLVQLVAEDWPYRTLLAVLGNGYFQRDWPGVASGAVAGEGGRAACHVIRQLQAPSGREALLAAVARLCERLRRQSAQAESEAGEAPEIDEASTSPREVRRALRRAELASDYLAHWKETLGRLPSSAAPGQWGKALRDVAEQLGLSRALETAGGEDLDQRDRAAWKRICELLDDGDTLFCRLGEKSPAMDCRQFLAWLADALASRQQPESHDETGRVRVLSAVSVRSLSVPYLFFAGLSERAFPAAQRADRVYQEAELRLLHDAGLPFPLRAERSQEEMLLFYEVLTRATRKLWLSYPALDERAEPLLASPYLADVQQACGGKVPRRDVTELSPIPPDGKDPLSPRSLRIHAVHEALAGGTARLAVLGGMGPEQGDGELLASVLHGLGVIGQRARRDSFGPYEGILTGKLVHVMLKQQFPPDRPWSASRLESFASCPFRFLSERLLNLEPLPDTELAGDHLYRGQLLHAALARLHRQLIERHGQGASPGECDADEWRRLVADVLKRLVDGDASLPAEAMLSAGLREIERRVVEKWLLDYPKQHREYDQKQPTGLDAPLRPAHFEVAFGDARGTSAPPSTPRPLVIGAGDDRIHLAGRIDRIDVGRRGSHTVFNVIDYKSGGPRSRPKNGDDPDPTRLQLDLYTLAAEQIILGRGSVASQSGYWHVRGEGFKGWRTYHHVANDDCQIDEGWEAARERLAPLVGRLVAWIRSGVFPVISADDGCTQYCPLHTVCRINQVRALEKTWDSVPGTTD